MNTAADGSLPGSDHRMTEFRILRKDIKLNRRVRTLNFRRWDFSLFKQLPVRFPKEAIIRKKGTSESWLLFFFFKENLFRAQELTSPLYREFCPKNCLVHKLLN